MLLQYVSRLRDYFILYAAIPQNANTQIKCSFILCTENANFHLLSLWENLINLILC